MLRLTVSLSLVLGLGAVAGEVFAPAVAVAAPEQAEDPLTEWNKRWDKALSDSANEYAKIVKKYEEKLEATSAYTRRRVLVYAPDDEENRKFLGYIKEKLNDGTENWKWVRNDVRREQVNELSDLDDPKKTKYNKEMTDANKRVVGWFKGLAKKAAENGAAKDASADAKWAEKAQRAWERVLEVDDSPGNKDAEEAHKALNHPKFEGKYVSQFKLQYAKARAERKAAGAKNHATAPKVTPVEPDGMFVTAGLTGGGAKSDHMTINTTHGKDVAIRLAQDCEQALNDLVDIYGYPPQIKERLGERKINVIKDEEEFKKFLGKGAGWKDAQITKYTEKRLLGINGVNNEIVATNSAGVDADDCVMSRTANEATRAAQSAARADLGSSVQGDVEDWLWQSIGYDVTKRVNGTAILIWGAFGRYGDSIEPRAGEDKWVELARRLVQTDDDIPLKTLPRLDMQKKAITGPQTIKGWAFLQFVFEKDAERAKKFVWNALANGTPTAIATIYPDNPDTPDPEKSMEKLDAEYREWILKSW